MKTKTAFLRSAVLLLLLAAGLPPISALAQGTAFTYQGRLNDANGPASGNFDLTFTLFATNIDGVAIAGPITHTAAVSNGLFNAMIDFGAVFTGSSNWLEIAVQTNGGSAFTTLARGSN